MIEAETIIIGAGPAGLFAAAHCKSNSVILLEKNELPGRKLLIAGSGRCNLTHKGDIGDFFDHYGKNSRFLKTALLGFNNEQLIHFFENHQMNCYTDKNGKVFPDSDSSSDVLQILLKVCKDNNVLMKTGQNVLDIKRSGIGFLIRTQNGEFQCKQLIIATGGKSYPKTGSTGDGFEFARLLGHSIVSTKPSLTPVFIHNFPMAELAGVTLINVPVYLYRENKKIQEHSGDICFTHKGLTGPGILDFSRFFENKDMLRINFSRITQDDFRIQFLQTADHNGKLFVKTFLKQFEIPNSLIEIILKALGIDNAEKMGNITKTQRNQIIQSFCEHPFPIDYVGGYEMAMVTAGGVALNEVSSKTMESKLHKGLYFIGEVLDIDGDTGGYNLQAAFSTAYLAAKSINSNIDQGF
jgi:predicted Rossmann fold flavoprotein